MNYPPFLSLAAAFLGLTLSTTAQTTIFSDDFSGDGSAVLNGSAPDVRPGSQTWVANNLTNDGKVTASSGQSSWLAYTFQNDVVYTLTATLDMTYSSGSITPGGIAFTQDNPLGNGAVNLNGSNDYGVLQVRRGGSWAFYEGPNNTTATASSANNALFTSNVDNYEIKLVLTTSSTANWTLAGFFNGSQVDLNPGDTGSLIHSFISTPSFTGFGINYGSSAIDFENFTLTASSVPEPSSYSLLMGGSIAGLALLRRRRVA